MSNKKYWDLTPQTGVTKNDLLTFAKQDGSDFIASYISIEDFLASISEDSNVNLGPVLDNTVSDPSTLTPNDGDRYIVASEATGAWSANTNSIAQWNDTDNQWDFYVPTSGDRTIVTTGVNAGKIYEFNGTSWNEVILPVTSATPFFLAGTSIDAGSDKTSRISRTGDVLIGSTGSSLNAKFVVNGKTIANAYATRTGFASTSDITRTGKWYRIMSFDCNYSIYATHHFKIILGFNGNSNGAGFVAELDINIKRQNTQIFVSSVIRQSINTAEIVYDENDRNIEFLWNNTTKRVTLYFRPDQNYSALSLTILNPRETASTRFSFLNQYTNATDLTGEVSDALTEKNIIMGDVIGVNFTTPILKRRILNELSNDYSQFIQNSQLFGLSAAYGDGSYDAQYIFSPQQFSFGISDNANSVTNNVLNSYSSNNYYLSDNANNITNQIEQSISSNRLNISDSNTNTYSDIFQNASSAKIENSDGTSTTILNTTASDVNIQINSGTKESAVYVDSNSFYSYAYNSSNTSQSEISGTDTELYFGNTDGLFQTRISMRSKVIKIEGLLEYINDAAADADPNLPSGALYKLTGSRAVYQKP